VPPEAPGRLPGCLQRLPGRLPGPPEGLLEAIGAFGHLRRLPEALRKPPSGLPETIPGPMLGVQK